MHFSSQALRRFRKFVGAVLKEENCLSFFRKDWDVPSLKFWFYSVIEILTIQGGYLIHFYVAYVFMLFQERERESTALWLHLKLYINVEKP